MHSEFGFQRLKRWYLDQRHQGNLRTCLKKKKMQIIDPTQEGLNQNLYPLRVGPRHCCLRSPPVIRMQDQVLSL